MDILFWKVVAIDSDDVVKVQNAAGGSTDYAATELGITLGLGVERLFWQRIGITAGLHVTYLTAIGTDFAEWVKRNRSRALMQFTFALSYNFGIRKKTLKEKYEKEMAKWRQEGVRTIYVGEIDEETGDTVFTDQARERRGEFVPVKKKRVVAEDDDDMDGIRNKRDKCPDTPLGALVDKDGCPYDADGDGVPDYRDRCAGTAPAR